MLFLSASCSKNNEQSDAYGNFEAKEVSVSSMSNGQLLYLNMNEGDQLKLNEVVGLVDSTELYLKKLQVLSQHEAVLTKLNSINAQLRVHQQQLDNILIDKNRIEMLFKDGAATLKQMDDINGAFSLAKKQIEATRSQTESIHAEAKAVLSQVNQLNEQLRKCFIINPIEGIVLTKFAMSGEVVTFGKSLYKIADVSELDLKVYVSGLQLVNFSVGQEVDVLIDKTKTENKILKGIISWISSSAEFTPKTIQTKEERVDLVYAMKVTVVNDGNLKIGMPGEIRIINKPFKN
ncbi:MAG: HlyD family secretion protein [Bacteroidetes bacterium HGW-Bacteroidetes-1]|nr:MAG: HlyD family secretion protein [Bacteroidetes bacterium HGW-Bacteroidetes-1]